MFNLHVPRIADIKEDRQVSRKKVGMITATGYQMEAEGLRPLSPAPDAACTYLAITIITVLS